MSAREETQDIRSGRTLRPAQTYLEGDTHAMPAVEEEDEKEQSDSPLDRFGDRLDGKDSDMFGRRVDASRKKDGDDSEE